MIKSFKINKQKGRFSLTPPIQCLNEMFSKIYQKVRLIYENDKLRRLHFKGAAT